MSRKPILALAGLAIIACTGFAFADTPPSEAKSSPDVSWLVIGIQPANARMEVAEPWMTKGVVWSFHYNLKSYHPVGGFIVVKAKPGVTYGIAASSLMLGKSIFGIRFQPCDQVPTFLAEAGKVLYVTTIAYRSEGATYYGSAMNMAESATYSQDLDGARAFLKTNYPGLSENLEQGSYEMTPVARRCR